MNIIDIILIALSLAMDAFAVSICLGLTVKQNRFKYSILIALVFALFQILMPLIGYKLGDMFYNLISSIDHYISFIILSIIGFKMIKDAIVKEDIIFNYLDLFTILFLGIATSIDAFVVGITLPYLNINLFTTIFLIFIITFILCFIGTFIGSKINNYKLYQIVGGLTLFAIGLKILFEHLKII